MMAYADPRAYTDRLNGLFTVRGWTREYVVQTITNVERRLHDGTQMAGKLVITCSLTIHRLGTHAGMGEEWADNENAGTAAEAQAFTLACTCFGLGRYLYDIEGGWVDLDERKQPKYTPKLPDWAIPKRQQVNGAGPKPPSEPTANGHHPATTANSIDIAGLHARIRALTEQVGYSLWRSVLMEIAKTEAPDRVAPASLAAVAEELEDTLRGVERLRAATVVVGQQRYSQLCRELNFASASLDDIPDRKGLRLLLDTLEKEAATIARRPSGGFRPTTNEGPADASNGDGRPVRNLGEARNALIKEARRVARLRELKVSEVVDRAAKGAFSLANLHRVTIAHLGAIQKATEILCKVS
jgi:Rad52/22 family double-strand break repair protein